MVGFSEVKYQTILIADLGKKEECPHKYAKCFKAELDCYKDEDTKERIFFRGCGGFATIGEDLYRGAESLLFLPVLGRDIIDESMRQIIWDTDSFTEKHRKGDHVVVDLPDSVCTNINV